MFTLYVQWAHVGGNWAQVTINDSSVRLHVDFDPFGVRDVDNRNNYGDLFVPFLLLREERPSNNYSVNIYNMDGGIDCTPPGTAV